VEKIGDMRKGPARETPFCLVASSYGACPVTFSAKNARTRRQRAASIYSSPVAWRSRVASEIEVCNATDA
jgi:hypothetical protein